jgi:O-acetylhomoserine/O-acetylserine sulfhydrylase-like pyridoxal-dependent enzyme
MSSKNFAINVLYDEHNIAKQIANLFGGAKTAKKMVDETRFSFLKNIGDYKSGIIHPASIKRQRLFAKEHVVSGKRKNRKDLNVCSLSEVFIELKA